MKYLISLLVVCLGTGCATRKDTTSKTTVHVPGTSVSAKRMASLRTPEIVKAYPVGRYSDSNYPDEMHEQHTLYRREQSPNWNYLPDPSPSYYANTSGELNAKQRAYAEALQEQNRVMQKRIEILQKEAGKVPSLQQELDQLKQKAGESSKPEPTPETSPSPAKPKEEEAFSCIDPSEITLFVDSDDQSQDFLISQMRLNDVFAAELAAAERRKISAATNASFLPRREFALLNH